MIHTTYIYFLHRGDNIPFYIGKSINPDLRKAEHRWKKKGAKEFNEMVKWAASKDK